MELCPSDEYFFEGAEKLLEIWFGSMADEEDESSSADLRTIPRSALESILKLVKCEVISMQRNDHMDAYVLSESSMFISRDRLIIKTCGNTGLLNCLDPVIYLAKEVAGFDEILDVFYSRKNFLRPDLQSDPHRSFAIETDILDSYFDEGAAYCMGRVNSDHLVPLHAGSCCAGGAATAIRGSDAGDPDAQPGPRDHEDVHEGSLCRQVVRRRRCRASTS